MTINTGKFSVAVCAVVKTPGLSPVKTRLAKTIGTERAEEFYTFSLGSISKLFESMSQKENSFQLKPYFAVAEEQALVHSFWKGKNTLLQVPGTLGAKLSALYNALQKTHKAVLFVGGDMPHLTVSHLEKSIEILRSETSDFVLGPTLDGGFYLFGGCQALPPEVFTNVEYSLSTTRAQLAALLESRGSVALLDVAFDVDEWEDLLQLGALHQEGLLPSHCSELFGFLSDCNQFGG
jgi:uncharacterized protein